MKFHETKGLAKFSKENSTGKRRRGKRIKFVRSPCYFCGKNDPLHDWNCPTIENKDIGTI